MRDVGYPGSDDDCASNPASGTIIDEREERDARLASEIADKRPEPTMPDSMR